MCRTRYRSDFTFFVYFCSGAASSSQQLPVEDVVEPHLRVPGEERADDGSHRFRVARGAAFVLQTAVQDRRSGTGRVTAAEVTEPSLNGVRPDFLYERT